MMTLTRLVRYLKGYVIFKTRGGFPERLINLCTLKQIELWNMKIEDNRLTAEILAQDYKRLRSVARRSGALPKIESRIGLPFFAKKHKDRVGIPIGLALCALTIFLLSQAIWSIELVGNTGTPDYLIIRELQENKLHIGALKSRLNTELIEEELQKSLPSIEWTAINIIGSKVYVEIHESTKAPPIRHRTSPSNMIAAKNGEITDLQVYEGQAIVKRGFSVVKGDLLISGIRENDDGSISIVHADGYAKALTVNKISIAVAKDTKFKLLLPQTRAAAIRLFHLRLPLSKSKGLHQTLSEAYIKNKETTLPIGVELSSFFTVEKAAHLADFSTIKKLAAIDFSEKYEKNLGSCEIVEASFYFSNDKNYSITASYSCIEDIATPQAFYVEEGF